MLSTFLLSEGKQVVRKKLLCENQCIRNNKNSGKVDTYANTYEAHNRTKQWLIEVRSLF